ncbi:hypothetical protein [Acholeplasma hippikon]|uniref:Uncharacterized protein n=1 Tax=Acholeplasma hippikon TaxID=264636 RepID=A0A449BJM6_9MOLU|nr:hypothetical protein [Acholeplasma hippikon]VEU82527.1 Uncharacterised protein [Acholeplasma hippikon]
MEKKVLSGKAIFFYVLAALSLIVGVLFATPVTNDLFGINFDKVVTGVLLLVGGTYLLLPNFMKSKDKFRWLFLTEIVVVFLVALLGFILPEFIDSLSSNTLPINQWVGLLFMLHATVHLVVDRFGSKKIKNYLFLLYILIAVFGGLLLDSKSINIPFLITLLIVALFVVVAIILAIKAYKLPKVTKKEKEVKEEKKKKEK